MAKSCASGSMSMGKMSSKMTGMMKKPNAGKSSIKSPARGFGGRKG